MFKLWAKTYWGLWIYVEGGTPATCRRAQTARTGGKFWIDFTTRSASAGRPAPEFGAMPTEPNPKPELVGVVPADPRNPYEGEQR